MPTRDDFIWFKATFASQIDPAIAGTPFTLDMLAAIAAQETGHIWGPLRKTLTLDDLLEVCVGDTLDADKGRAAFPKTKAELVAFARGADMFKVGRDALVKMALHVPSFAKIAKRPDKFCHGYGIFQYDIQFFKKDPDYFLEKRWCRFDASLQKCIEELQAARKRAGLAGKPALTDDERVHVAIAYNAGTFKPAKGLQQGHFDGKKFYGEKIFDFLRESKAAVAGAVLEAVEESTAGAAIVTPPTAVTPGGELLEVDVKDSPLRLRSEPKVDKSNPGANVIARLPDGHIVRLVSGSRDDRFVEVETSFNGARFRGFAASEFLVRAAPDATIPIVAPDTTMPDSGVVAVFAPRKAGTVTKRTAEAGPHSLNEPGQPQRQGTTPEELREELARIIDFLAVDRASHRRYHPREKKTFCNIYAHDVCHLAGVYLPRVWWTADAIERLARGETVEPRLEGTIMEQRANALFLWLRAFGPRFGWRQTSTLTRLQTEANAGALGMIVARRHAEGLPGHIAMVVPETREHEARRDSAGEVVAPLQSQAGGTNFRYGTGRRDWWTSAQFADSAFWLHA